MSCSPRDDFYVLIYNFIEPLFSSGSEKTALAFRRFREMGVNGGCLTSPFVNRDGYLASVKAFGLPPPEFKLRELGAHPFLDHQFPFYVENMVRPIYEKWEKSKPVFRKMYETFARQRDRKVFVRVPCVNNPAVDVTMRRRIAEIMDGLKDARHLFLLYNLRDEPSITAFLLAADTCFCEHCLKRMREWLQGRYPTLEALNAEWGTAFGSWDQVEPITTQEALERRRSGDWSFAPWHDHRTFMNETFRRVVAELADEVRRRDPEARVGLAGTQCPWVFGGYDFSELVPVLDWAEPYAFGGSLDCFRSFKQRRHVPLLRTIGLGGGLKAGEAMLWHYVYIAGGDAGTIIWNSNVVVDGESPRFRLPAASRELGRSLAELRSGAPRLLQLAVEVTSPVAVHYSQASINADFIVSVPDRWRSVAASVSEDFPARKCREAWWALLEDCGLRPTHVSSKQIEAGELLRRGVKLLILPRSIAVSDAEVREMRRFVEAGGTLVADSFAGRMDEHCRERPVGALDALFGIRRPAGDGYHASTERASLDYGAKPDARPVWGGGPLRARCSLIEEGLEPLDGVRVLGCSEYTDSPLGFLATHGRGRALLFNAAPLDYLAARASAAAGHGGGDRQFFAGILELAGVVPEIELRSADDGRPLPGWRVFPFRHGRACYFGLSPDLGISQDILGAVEVHGEDRAGRRVEVRLPVAGHLYEARSGRYLGRGTRAELRLEPTSAPLLALLPYKVRGLKLAFDGTVARAALRTAGGRPGEHVLRFDVLDAKGRRLLDSGANVVALAGAAEWKPEGKLPKGGRLVCRDVATGVSAEKKLP